MLELAIPLQAIYSHCMEREVIRSTIAKLPASELGKIAADHEIWEETDGDAQFKVTCHTLPVGEGIRIISMNVSGPENERARIIREFSEIYGNPEPEAGVISQTPEGIPIDFVMWVV